MSGSSRSSAESVRAYRKRLLAAGGKEVLFQLPQTTIALLDEIKEQRGFRSRSQALVQLIELGKEAIRQTA